jgi:hypothetical protein
LPIKLFKFVLSTWLVLDILSGVSLNMLGYNLTLFIRATIILLILIYGINIRAYSKLFYLSFLFLTLISSLHLVTFQNFTSLYFTIKIIFPVALIHILLKLISQKLIFFRDIIKFYIFCTSIFTLSIVSGQFFGGYKTYDYGNGLGFGSTGWFYAGNEVSITGLVLCGLGAVIYLKTKKKTDLILLIVSGMSTILVLTKTSVVGVLYILTRVIKFSFTSISLIASLLYFAVIINMDYVVMFTKRIEHEIGTAGYLNILMGGSKRIEYIKQGFFEIYDYPLIFLFGRGWNGLAENDLVDTFLSYGVFSILILILYIEVIGKVQRKNKIKNFTNQMIMIIFLSSLIAGHVVTSTMLSPILAIFYCSNTIDYEKNISYNKRVTFKKFSF